MTELERSSHYIQIQNSIRQLRLQIKLLSGDGELAQRALEKLGELEELFGMNR